MSSTAILEQKRSTVEPRRKVHLEGNTQSVNGIIRLPNTRHIITFSIRSSSLRVWDLESGVPVGEWKDEGNDKGVFSIALSPNGTTVASGSIDGAVRLWDIDKGKVIKKCTGHKKIVWSVCWSPDGGRVASGSLDHTFRVWDVKSGNAILGPIQATSNMPAFICYSPDGTMIATNGHQLNIWDANTGERLRTIQGKVWRMAWTSINKKTLLSIMDGGIRKLDTTTWTKTTFLKGHKRLNKILLSENERILASVSHENTVQLWNLENGQLIGPPLRHEKTVKDMAFSADGKLLTSGCEDGCIYTWDISAIITEAGLHNLLSDKANVVNKSVLNADVTRRRAPKIEDVRRVPQGFFDDFSTSRDHHGDLTTAPRQPTHISRNPLNWAQNFVSGMLRKHDGSNIQLPRVVEVPLTAGKPRNYHARKKRSASSSRPTKPPTTQQKSGGATQSNLSSSQQQSATATTSTTPPVAGAAAATGTSHLDVTIKRAGWRARFLLWVCCVPNEHTASG